MDFRVLGVCPDQASADLLGKVLPELCIEFEHTPSLSRGLERLEAQPFDAVILDYHADEISHEFLSKLRLSGKNRGTLLIAIVDSEFSARPVFGLGANFVLYRPLSPERTRLSLQAARGLMRRERRRAPRIPVNVQASFDHAAAQDQTGTLLDLSDGGTSLHADRRLPPACKVYFQFALPGQDRLIRLSGEVVWQDSNGRSGLRFVDVPQASRRLIQAWLLQNAFKLRAEAGRSSAPAGGCGAGSKSDASHATQAGNRRGERRFPCKLGADVYRMGTNIPQRCTLSDISEGGCYVEMPTPLSGQTGVEILVRTADMKLKIRGQVLAVHPGFGMGVRFMFRDNSEREEVLRLLALLAANPAVEELPR